MDDLISRQKAIKQFCREYCECEPEECGLTLERDGTEECSVVRFLKGLPSVQTEQKRGKWLNAEHAPNYLCYCTCSVCGKRQTIEIANYCPNCGAKMDMERE